MKDTKRVDEYSGIERNHNSLCEHAEHEVCNCWCKGKYHGISRMVTA